jgi:hypothetical protein
MHRRVLLELRRSRDELEAAREEFHHARAEFTKTLDVWGLEEKRRDMEYDKKLGQTIGRLQAIGSQCVQKALKETSKTMFEMVWLLSPFDQNSQNVQFALNCGDDNLPGPFCGSRQQAEEFLRVSQQKLTSLLLDLKHRFVSTVRELADRANKDRVERLKEAIRAFKNDMESELRSEILVDLESLPVNVRALAF